MYDLIVVGGGPAGLTATMYAIKKRLDVLLVSKDLGGKTRYRLSLPWTEGDYQVIRGIEVVDKFRRELEYLDFARQMEPVEKITRNGDGFTVQTREGAELAAKAVILATGARQQRLRVPGEEEFIMRGLCYSALSYAPLFIDRSAAVVGSADLALRSAAELATVAQEVTLIGPTESALATPLGQKLLADKKVKILQGYEVTRVSGDGYASGLMLKGPDGSEMELQADGTFVEMSLMANSGMVEGLVALDEEGRVKVDCYSRTDVPGLFAAGDVTNTYAEQVLVAVGEGAKAALSAYDYLLPKL